MRINHNIAALNTYRQLIINNRLQQSSLEKLSSGFRINKAADDAAGLAISEKMRGQIRGLEQAQRNAQDGISLIQTAEGGLNETHSILQRMRELAVQASNETTTDSDRAEIQKEIAQLKEEIDRIAQTTEFNTKKLLNGDLETAKEARATILQSVVINAGGSTDVSSGTVSYDAYEITSNNNTLTFNISDGTDNQDFTITLTEGKYTYTQLRTELQNKMNEAISGSSDAEIVGTSVTVSDNSGKLQFATNSASLTLTIKSGDSAGSFEATFLQLIDDLSATDTGDTADGLVKDAATLFEVANSQTINITFDGSTYTFTINDSGAAVAMSAQEIADKINSQISNNSAIAGKFGASINSDGKLVITSYVNGKSATLHASAFTVKLGATVASTTDNTTGAAETTLLTEFRDENGNAFGLQVGDVIKINGKIGGTAITETTYTVTASSTIQDLMNSIESAFNLDANSGKVELTSDGYFKITGESGTAYALADVKLSVENRDLFNNKFSAFRETQAAQDKHVDSSLSMHIGSNEDQTMKVDINEMSVRSLMLTSVDVSTQEGAETAISVINNAIDKVSAERSKLGAFQNRLEHSIANLGTSAENLAAAESRIRDVDMAKEMMEFTKLNILAQAAQAMLAQANQLPQGVLQLLR